MKFLKYLFRISVGLFALIGVLAVCAYCYLECSEKYYISIEENKVVTPKADFIDLLKQSPFKADTVQYHFAVVQDSVRAQEISDFFNLDSLYRPDASTWEKHLPFPSLSLPVSLILTPGFCLSIIMPSTCGNSPKKRVQASTAVVMPSLTMS